MMGHLPSDCTCGRNRWKQGRPLMEGGGDEGSCLIRSWPTGICCCSIWWQQFADSLFSHSQQYHKWDSTNYAWMRWDAAACATTWRGISNILPAVVPSMSHWSSLNVKLRDGIKLSDKQKPCQKILEVKASCRLSVRLILTVWDTDNHLMTLNNNTVSFCS